MRPFRETAANLHIPPAVHFATSAVLEERPLAMKLANVTMSAKPTLLDLRQS